MKLGEKFPNNRVHLRDVQNLKIKDTRHCWNVIKKKNKDSKIKT